VHLGVNRHQSPMGSPYRAVSHPYNQHSNFGIARAHGHHSKIFGSFKRINGSKTYSPDGRMQSRRKFNFLMYSYHTLLRTHLQVRPINRFSCYMAYLHHADSRKNVRFSGFIDIIIIIIIQHLYSAIVSYAGCRGACGAS